MSEAEEQENRETQHTMSSQIRSFPRDLLQRLVSRNHIFPKNLKISAKEEEEEDDDDDEVGEIELSLGLSMNGRFGIDPRAQLKLTRSSSIPDFINTAKSPDSDNETTRFNGLVGPTAIGRTCSLPIETEEEWRKRKELQTIRRMAAKRKRSEKQRNLRALREKHKPVGVVGQEEILEDNNKRREGSIGSSGSGSSGLSELENQPVQGSNKSSDTRSPSSNQSPNSITPNNQTSKETAAVPRNEAFRNILEDMPCVSTKGDGPNGRRIEGFLYRYRKGEEVRIVCVCHGSFLSPAEFVKHAGGGDVAHPLKHIVVNPSPFL